jgi:hypothetical protein
MKIEATGKPEGCKLIRISADIEDGVIKAFSIRGDFFANPEEGFERAEARLPGTPAAELETRFDRFLAEEGVSAQGITGKGLAEVFRSALTAAEG